MAAYLALLDTAAFCAALWLLAIRAARVAFRRLSGVSIRAAFFG
jgi:hypothetical protein